MASDHPRSRGEYGAVKETQVHSLGSSPLSRGIRGCRTVRPPTPRIIPALAGNTLAPSASIWTPPDHPRSRGEYRHPEIVDDRVKGSSPLSRGIPSTPKQDEGVAGIIPALAGNTQFQWAKTRVQVGSSPLSRGIPLGHWENEVTMEDHPRSRGEYFSIIVQVEPRYGSSPLSRGIRS